MRFWNREREISELLSYLKSEPNSILFVYGPRSCGKTTLLLKMLEQLPPSFFTYFYDLRDIYIGSVEDFVRYLFAGKESTLSALSGVKLRLSFFEVSLGDLREALSNKVNLFPMIREKLQKNASISPEARNLLVFDELQKLKNLYINGDRLFISELFNFFVRLTKVLHLSHVIVSTSDTFFIEEIYTESLLEGCAEYYKVDYFSRELAKEVLIAEGMSEQEAEYVVSWCGGVPWFLERVLRKREIMGLKKAIEGLYSTVKGRVREALGRVYDELGREGKERALSLLERSLDGTVISDEERNIARKLVSLEVLYYDPVSGEVSPLTPLHVRAVEELLAGRGERA